MKCLQIMFIFLFTTFFASALEREEASGYEATYDTLQDEVLEYTLLNNELDYFIQIVKHKDSTAFEHMVFVVNIHHYNKVGDVCFTLGYILNDYEVEYIAPQHLYCYKDQLVLIRSKDELPKIFSASFHPMNSANKERVLGKLYQSKFVSATYTSFGMIFCKEKDTTHRKEYNVSDSIPLDISVWGNFPDGMTIERVR